MGALWWVSLISCISVASSFSQQDTLLAVLKGLGMENATAEAMAGKPCSADGIRCDEGGAVVHLILKFQHLRGEIPKELGQLKSLRVLDLGENHLTGEMPPELGRLEALQTLNLGGNQLSGAILREIGQLMVLEKLWLYDNQLSGAIPKELGQLKALKRVGLSRNQLGGSIPKELGQLEALQELALHQNQLTGAIPRELGKLKMLLELGLSQNQLSGAIPRELGELKSLVWLDLHGNQLTGAVPKELGQLQALSELLLYRNQLSGSIPSELGQLKVLEELWLGQNQLSGAIPRELGQLKELERLALSQNQLDGAIPKELGELKSLYLLHLGGNQLSGAVPKELGQLKALEKLLLHQNQLSGAIPRELGQLKVLKHLRLNKNQLDGAIPKELGELKSLNLLYLAGNQLSNEIPRELGKLPALQNLWLYDNQLSGAIPKELGQLNALEQLALDQNQLSGAIPKELGRLRSLRLLSLSRNRLSGDIPSQLGELESLAALGLGKNQLVGKMPSELGHLKFLEELDLSGNQLSGGIADTVFNSSKLTTLLLGSNLLGGRVLLNLPSKQLVKLEVLDLSHNQFVGGIEELIEPFCKIDPVLRVLRLNHNKLSSVLPGCLMKFQHLQLLALNNNAFSGVVPEVQASELAVLTLHSNAFEGPFPPGLDELQKLGTLTMHENRFEGTVLPLKLISPCINNARFRDGFAGASCRALSSQFVSCSSLEASSALQGEIQEIWCNCPKWCNSCPNITANVTLHRNRFSGAVPSSINRTSVLALTLMGNMLGNGHDVLSTWVAAEEQQPFLYYSEQTWKSHMQLLSGLCVIFALLGIFSCQLGRRFRQTSRNLHVSAAAFVASSNFAVLKAAAVTFLLGAPLSILFVLKALYYASAPPIWKLTVANFEAEDLSGFVAIAFWSAMLLLFQSLLMSAPQVKRSQSSSCIALDADRMRKHVGRLARWIVWFCIVTIFALPSILYAFSHVLPANTSLPVSQGTLKWFNTAAPLVTIVVDMVLAGRVSTKYSTLSGIKADRLLMTFRLLSAWLLALMTSILLDENCMAGWKWTWRVCEQGSPEHNRFNWQVYGEEILNTRRDICAPYPLWWQDGRCTRSVVGNLAPFLLKKLLFRVILQPVMLIIWRFSRLDPGDITAVGQQGRHLRILGGKKTTGSLVPLKQSSLLTTHLETLIFWSPLIPVLSFAVGAAVLTNLLIFDVGLRDFGVVLPQDDVNMEAGISRSYLGFALGAGSFFQLWYAFSTNLWGRHVLLAVHIAILGPWSKYYLPIDTAKRWFWNNDDVASNQEVVEMSFHNESHES